MEYARDLGRVELWEESLRRSLERRGTPRRSSVELHRLRPARDLTLADVIERSAHYSRLRRQALERQALPRPSAALGGVSALALVAAATVPKLVEGGGSTGHPAAVVQEAAASNSVSSPARTVAPPIIPPASRAAHPVRPVIHHRAAPRPAPTQKEAPTPTHAPRATSSTAQARTASVSHSSGGAGLTVTPKHTVAKAPVTTHHPTTASHTTGGAQVKPKSTTAQPPATHPSTPTTPAAASGAYMNPLAHASVTPERIDQGVDYSGSGTLTAIGAGRVTYVGTSGTGWPGAFIEYRLAGGADSGRYVYYAEGVRPLVRVGQTLRAGQSVATMSGGIEVGWGSGLGTQPLAQAQGQWKSGSDAGNVATPAGRSFSALIASLGGPPGKVEG